ncbi:MAG: hypothetical protein WEB04_03890 [Dehalococcoidia bacterium]
MDMLASKGTAYSAARTSIFGSPIRLVPLLVLAAAVALVVLTVTLSLVTGDRGTWSDATAAAGIVATVVAAGVMLGTKQGWANGTKMSLAAISTALVGMGALALVVVTYAGGAGDVNVSSAASNVSQEGEALSGQISKNEVVPPGYAHDVGSHPTITQFLEMDNAEVLANVPGGTLLPNEVDTLRSQLQGAREFALAHNTPEKAIAAGFYNTTNDVPFMGAHFINSEYLTDGVFDAGKPEGLLFSKLGNPDGEWQMVGVWYLLLPGQGGATVDAPPAGFAGNLELWHAHYGLCTRQGVISENNTAEGCAADNGNFIGDLRWMMHTWVYPETGVDNKDGVFTYLNNNLFDQQSKADAPILGR